MNGAVLTVLSVCWYAFLGVFLITRLRIRRRLRQTDRPGRRVLSAHSSDLGALLEVAAIAMAFLFQRSSDEPAPTWVALPALLLSVTAVFLSWYALKHLGRHWRIRAVVTEDHELIQTGPYAVVRHPIYTALLCLLLATVLLRTPWHAGIAAVALYLIGTAIRIRAEERILARQFPREFAAYRRRVPALIPWVR